MRVSVIIPVYNAAPYLAEAVRSALALEDTGEVLLIDDQSADDSLARCRQWAVTDARVRVLQHADGKNHGAAATRNVGIRAARCPYVAFLDADDAYLPNRFTAARRILESDPGVDGVYDAIRNVFDSEALADSWPEPVLYTLRVPTTAEQLFARLVVGGQGNFNTQAVTVRREVFAKTGGFDERLPVYEDTMLWIKMAAVCRLVAGSVDEPVCCRRVHGGNLSCRHRADYPRYRARMWRYLLAWGKANRLPAGQMLLLVDASVEQWCAEIPAYRGWRGPRQRLARIAFLLGILWRFPLARRSRQFRDWAAGVCGWRRFFPAR